MLINMFRRRFFLFLDAQMEFNLRTQVPFCVVNHFHSPYSNVITDNIVNDFYRPFIALSNTLLTQEAVFNILCTIPYKKSFTNIVG